DRDKSGRTNRVEKQGPGHDSVTGTLGTQLDLEAVDGQVSAGAGPKTRVVLDCVRLHLPGEVLRSKATLCHGGDTIVVGHSEAQQVRISGARRSARSGQQQSPEPSAWGLCVERVTGIEPAL
ncbi:hypothetical protein ABZW02_37065, partial [Streptomyces sp. NPDC005180]|uniref:hypothetical protein n=1 Tax=Streptomyces sp. NPDC005180 TaxID=3156868 RepID=UPI0033B7266C